MGEEYWSEYAVSGGGGGDDVRGTMSDSGGE